MALQGRKPGWLLDRILGRESTDEEPTLPEGASPAATATLPGSVELLSPTSPSPAVPDLSEAVPAAEPVPPATAPVPPPPSADAEQIPTLRGAALEPLPGSPRPSPVPEPPTVPEPPAVPEPAEVLGPPFVPELPPALPAPPPSPVPPPPPLEASPPSVAEPASEPRRSWFRRLADGMRRTSSALGDGVTGLFTKAKLDRATLDDLEDLLIGADLGVETASRITDQLSSSRYERGIAPAEVKAIMAGEIEAVLAPVARPLTVASDTKPFVLLMIGVNGAGKTTTIGKLARKFRHQGLSVTIAAGDTFRAAAIEQLKVWGERVGAPVISRAQGSDAAGLAFDALEEAKASGADVLMIDTAGRLQNKAGLMAELEKIIRVIRKIDPSAPHATLLVLDATVGQNAVSQVELFSKAAGVTGLVMTKLDGTARGGILVALAAKFGLPIHFIGVGEGVDDLEPFTARDFARAIAGLDEAA